MDVQGLRTYVRQQMDVDDEELPDSLLNIYLQEAYDRTMAFSNKWPRNEYTWQLSQVADADGITLPADLNQPGIISLRGQDTANQWLTIMNHENAESMFNGGVTVATGTPAFGSVWGGKLYLWPRAQTLPYSVTLRGYRQPVWSNGASDIPDLDVRLHVTLAYFALSLAYAQQEDEVLEGVYLARWNRDLLQQLKSITEPIHNSPLVMHGAGPYGNVPSYVIIPPGSD